MELVYGVERSVCVRISREGQAEQGLVGKRSMEAPVKSIQEKTVAGQFGRRREVAWTVCK